MSTSKETPNIIPGDFADRTLKRTSPVATTIFVGLRAADVFLQHGLLSCGWATSLISRLGGQPISPLAPAGTASILGLQPYHAIVLSMALGSTIKQSIWILFVSEQTLPISGSLVIPALNTFVNSINTVLSAWALTALAPHLPQAWMDLSELYFPTQRSA